MLRRRKQMKYCINSSVARAAAKLIPPLPCPCDGLCGGRCPVGCVPCLPRGSRRSQFSLAGSDVLPIHPLAPILAGKPEGWGKAWLCRPMYGGGVTPTPAPGCPTGTSGWTFWECHVAHLAIWSGHSNSVPAGPPHHTGHPPPPTADPTLPPPRRGWHKKEYSLSLFE